MKTTGAILAIAILLGTAPASACRTPSFDWVVKESSSVWIAAVDRTSVAKAKYQRTCWKRMVQTHQLSVVKTLKGQKTPPKPLMMRFYWETYTCNGEQIPTRDCHLGDKHKLDKGGQLIAMQYGNEVIYWRIRRLNVLKKLLKR